MQLESLSLSVAATLIFLPTTTLSRPDTNVVGARLTSLGPGQEGEQPRTRKLTETRMKEITCQALGAWAFTLAHKRKASLLPNISFFVPRPPLQTSTSGMGTKEMLEVDFALLWASREGENYIRTKSGTRPLESKADQRLLP